jgi:PAS domain S-box-containing protein
MRSSDWADKKIKGLISRPSLAEPLDFDVSRSCGPAGERPVSESLAALQHAITRILADAGTVVEARPRLLGVLAEHLQSDVAEFWEIDLDINLLCESDVWARSGLDVTDFHREGLLCVHRPGAGLAGLAWAQKRVLWAPDLVAPGVRERLSAAEALGLTSSLAMPVSVGTTVLAVIQFYARSAPEPPPDCVEVLATLGGQIGQFIVRKRSELVWRRTHERLQALVASCPLAIFAFDVDGYVRMWNPAAERIFGWSEPEVLGRHTPIVPPDKQQESLLFRASVLRGEPITGVHVQRRTKDGRLLDVSLSTGPTYNAAGDVTGGMSIIQDISEEKAAERELLDAHDETERMLSAIASVFVGIRADGRVTRWNGAARRTFGLATTEVLGRQLGQCGIDWDFARIEHSIAACRASREPVHLDDCPVVVDGKTRYLNLVLNPVTAGREADSVVLLASDVTDYRALQSQLGQAQRLEAIGQLAAGVAHEINTPTQYVGDNVRFFQDTWPSLQRVLECASELAAARTAGGGLDAIADRLTAAVAGADLEYLLTEIPTAMVQTLDGVGRVSEIVRAMKEFSHPGVRDKTALDINRAIETTISVSRHEWRYTCEVVTDLDAALPLVPCLPGEFNQVMLNLLVNAAHAIADVTTEGGEKGRIRIATRHVDDAVEIHVSDTGSGIPETIRDRVFDPFFTTKEVGRGTGQGLAIAHNVVVHKHRGRIWFESEPGRGTTFHVRLPLRDPAADRSEAHAHAL